MKAHNAETTKTYRGSCHCGAVRFEVDLDLSAGTGQCNCTFCWKAGWWGVLVKPSAFRLLSGQDALADYSRSAYAHHRFCKRCGIRPFSDGDVPDIGGPFVSVNVRCLEGVDLSGVLIRYLNGRNDTWQKLGEAPYANPFADAPPA